MGKLSLQNLREAKMVKFMEAMRDRVLGGGQPTILIGVMGMTGAGKSTFIKNLTKDPDIAIGNRLTSCTKDVQPALMTFPAADGKEYEVSLVDTPGFDDTEMSDTDVLYKFVEVLQLAAMKDLKLSGLIYLHRITDNRMTGTGARNLHMMKQLVGEGNMRNVVFVTSRWETKIDIEEAEERERLDLLGPGGFWHDMIEHGATNARYDGSPTAAYAIIERIIHQSPTFLLIQEELKRGMNLPETAAGQALLSQYEKDAIKRDEELTRIREEMQKANQSAERSALLLEAQEHRYSELLEKMKRDDESLKKLMEGDKERLEARIQELEDSLKKKSGKNCIFL